MSLRVKTELVQSAVTVVDKDGRFVNGLTRDQFELIVDGKPRRVNFFERVTSGSPARATTGHAGQSNRRASPNQTTTPVVLGRRIVFFIDDLHLSPDSMNRTRQMLHQFLDAGHDLERHGRDCLGQRAGRVPAAIYQQQARCSRRRVIGSVRDPTMRSGFGTGSTRMTEYLALNIENTKSDNTVHGLLHVGECHEARNMPPKRSAAYASLIAALKQDL